jgi:hypothetical protein
MHMEDKTTLESESRLSYSGWKVVLAGFFGVMVSFAALGPSTFSLFIKPLSAAFGWLGRRYLAALALPR